MINLSLAMVSSVWFYSQQQLKSSKRVDLDRELRSFPRKREPRGRLLDSLLWVPAFAEGNGRGGDFERSDTRRARIILTWSSNRLRAPAASRISIKPSSSLW